MRRTLLFVTLAAAAPLAAYGVPLTCNRDATFPSLNNPNDGSCYFIATADHWQHDVLKANGTSDEQCDTETHQCAWKIRKPGAGPIEGEGKRVGLGCVRNEEFPKMEAHYDFPLGYDVYGCSDVYIPHENRPCNPCDPVNPLTCNWKNVTAGPCLRVSTDGEGSLCNTRDHKCVSKKTLEQDDETGRTQVVTRAQGCWEHIEYMSSEHDLTTCSQVNLCNKCLKKEWPGGDMGCHKGGSTATEADAELDPELAAKTCTGVDKTYCDLSVSSGDYCEPCMQDTHSCATTTLTVRKEDGSGLTMQTALGCHPNEQDTATLLRSSNLNCETIGDGYATCDEAVTMCNGNECNTCAPPVLFEAKPSSVAAKATSAGDGQPDEPTAGSGNAGTSSPTPEPSGNDGTSSPTPEPSGDKSGSGNDSMPPAPKPSGCKSAAAQALLPPGFASIMMAGIAVIMAVTAD